MNSKIPLQKLVPPKKAKPIKEPSAIDRVIHEIECVMGTLDSMRDEIEFLAPAARKKKRGRYDALTAAMLTLDKVIEGLEGVQ